MPTPDLTFAGLLPETATWIKLISAVAAGGTVGLDREIRERSAGLRTHMLTSLAAALFTLLTFEIYAQVQSLESSPNADPLRLVEAVTLGVSFLAAGAIIQRSGHVHGLTTGATIWLAGALGVAAGAGLYNLLVPAVLLGLLITLCVRLIEKYLLHTKE